MTFSRYGEYLAALAARDQLFALAAFTALSFLVFVLGFRSWPKIQATVAWLMTGVYYALMALIYLWWRSRA